MAYFTKVTETGAAVIAAAIAAGETVPIAQLCVGDGNGSDHEPVGTETALVHQVWAGAVTGRSSEGDTLTVEAAIPHDVGGFTIREIGILDSDGALIAIGNYTETLKPAADAGGLVEILIRMIVKFETDVEGVIEITIDPGSVYATKTYADDAVLEHANLTNPHSSTPEATALRLVLRDANGRAKFGAGSDNNDAVIMSQLLEHAGLMNPHSATPEATALRLALRDANGRAKFAPGVSSEDAVNVGQFGNHTERTAAHSSTPDATPGRIVMRDASGRAAFAAGSASGDAVNLGQVNDLIAARIGAWHTATPSAGFSNFSINEFRYRLEGTDIVRLSGVLTITDAAAYIITVLPVGFRPIASTWSSGVVQAQDVSAGRNELLTIVLHDDGEVQLAAMGAYVTGAGDTININLTFVIS
jgi:phage-related tail fiber protein